MAALREETLIKNLLRHEKMLKGMITALVGDRVTAEDLFQETAVIMTRKREQFPEDGSFAAWSCAIAKNIVRDHRKKMVRQKVRLLDEEALEAVAAVFEGSAGRDWEDRRRALEECTEILPPEHRDLMRKRYEENVPVGKIAGLLNKTRGAVDTMLYRVRKALLDCVETKLARWGVS
jgi:RNA polymerase sigma-70 factor (ECF subfamily)